jgi:hypothetical protein
MTGWYELLESKGLSEEFNVLEDQSSSVVMHSSLSYSLLSLPIFISVPHSLVFVNED